MGMYPAFQGWIRSHRDLPLLLNQWNSVVRWEFKDPTPFLRTREFLWQEGHTAHSSFDEANEMVMKILELYRRTYEELLAVPVIKGRKTEAEKFAGGDITTTVEAYINGSGRSIQGATSHHLGQNFGKMFDIKYEDVNKEQAIPWQTSWGFTTRSIGVMVMVHGDDQGLVLPPRIAPIQVIGVSVVKSSATAEENKALEDYLVEIVNSIKDADPSIRIEIDSRKDKTAGWRYNYWEQKGVPLRIEVGARDKEKGECVLVPRINLDPTKAKKEKQSVAI